jgi:glycerol-3-phosphate dehydrogenase (NAD(P)+)
MSRLLAFQGADTLDNLAVGLGDLYVTVYGGRTRLVGRLLGRGLTIDEALEELNGVTLESLVVARRVARAVCISAERKILNTADFPLLFHIDSILNEKASPELPWDSFRFEYNK